MTREKTVFRACAVASLTMLPIWLARVGGEEFAILCPLTDRHQARFLAKRLCRIVSDTCLATPDGPLRMTVSLGVASLRTYERSADSILSRVDRALYRAKNEGRNQVSCSWELPPVP